VPSVATDCAVIMLIADDFTCNFENLRNLNITLNAELATATGP
jgi:hypothetical protein